MEKWMGLGWFFIKVKKNSQITFSNQKDFTLNGNCKNVIKGGVKSSIIFDSSNGLYTVNAYQNGISSDDYLKFNGGKFVVTTKTGDAIKSSPENDDTDSLGKIIVNDGTFNIESFGDAFQAKNKILIKNGIFNIKTENGYQSKTFDKDTGSAKGFKVRNNATGIEEEQDYYFDSNSFAGNPYNYETAITQEVSHPLDGVNFVRVKSISKFV